MVKGVPIAGGQGFVGAREYGLGESPRCDVKENECKLLTRVGNKAVGRYPQRAGGVGPRAVVSLIFEPVVVRE